jgi:hypothetical protein
MIRKPQILLVKMLAAALGGTGNYQAAIRELYRLIQLRIRELAHVRICLTLVRELRLCSLFCPVQRQPTATELLERRRLEVPFLREVQAEYAKLK